MESKTRSVLDYEFPMIYGKKPDQVDDNYSHIYLNNVIQDGEPRFKMQMEVNIESLRDNKKDIIDFLNGEYSTNILKSISKSIIGCIASVRERPLQ